MAVSIAMNLKVEIDEELIERIKVYCRRCSSQAITSVVSQKFIYIFNAMALAEIKSPFVPLFQRGRCLREGVNPSLPN